MNIPNKKSQNVKDVLSRLKDLLDLRTDIELAKILEVRPNTLATWKQRNSMDYRLVITTCDNFNLDLNKVFLDDGDKFEAPGTNRNGFTAVISKQLIQQYINGELSDKLTNLPHYNFSLGEGKQNRAFQVTNDLLAPELPFDSFAICDSSSLEDLEEERKYVIISKKYGLIISRIIQSNTKSFKLIDFQNTGLRQGFIINIRDINEIWKVIGVSTYSSI